MINTERRNQITEIAWQLWDDFLAYKSPAVRSRDLLTPSIRQPSVVSKEFFRFCVQVCTQQGNAPPVDASIVRYDLSEANRAAQNRPASWLVMTFDARLERYPTIVIDYATLYGRIAYFRTQQTINRLVLHETGHVVLHWEQLQPNTRNGDLALAKSAVPFQEVEAWWFCLSIFGRVIAEVADENARNPANADDQIWLDLNL
jgi:hypothetical protein